MKRSGAVNQYPSGRLVGNTIHSIICGIAALSRPATAATSRSSGTATVCQGGHISCPGRPHSVPPYLPDHHTHIHSLIIGRWVYLLAIRALETTLRSYLHFLPTGSKYGVSVAGQVRSWSLSLRQLLHRAVSLQSSHQNDWLEGEALTWQRCREGPAPVAFLSSTGLPGS